MKLKWYGHASFLITGDGGLMILTDPYTPETSGYRPVTESPDIVVMSSDNDSFHCRADLILGQPTVINALDIADSGSQRTEKGVTFQAIHAMEALDHPEHDPDQNAMYRFTVDGVSLGHMGDVGNPLSDQQMAFLEGVDVLLALTGGPPSIELDDLMALIQYARPRWVVPMHFRTLRYKPRNTYWLQTFLDLFAPEEVDFACDCEATISPDSLPDATRVLVLAHA